MIVKYNFFELLVIHHDVQMECCYEGMEYIEDRLYNDQ